MEEVWNRRQHAAGSPDASLDVLAARIGDGDRAAFDDVYFLLVDDIYAYARSHCRNDADAEDVVATVFLRAWQYAKRYRRSSRSYRRWIFGIARNEVRNAFREWKRAQDLVVELKRYSSEQPGRPAGQFSDFDVERALAALTADQRDVIILRYLNDKSPAEIAQLLGKREGSIRALQHRGLKQLRLAVNHVAP